ncbi:ATP-binding cassette domain-containing protein [Paracraurococcus lichenis]|uniref:ATP-binding cassette domain-containing protein n=1 Tax=Paracraurococcus lichenis TaxID=3064888 RepID=A0ABT9E5H0_9PROT|nr:ATP-binding cassette domain-containing protein [Paracraurococcus sp. LOR1-02]MDO9711414.1 ATP-binding cassette domain-containing protein [Paracraurococcus sp. LOR1-02]
MSAALRNPGLRLRDVGVTPGAVLALVLLTVASQLAFLAFLLVMKHISDGVMDTRNGATAIAFAGLYALIVVMCAGYGHLRSAILGAIAERLGITLQVEALQAAVRNAVRTDTAQGTAVLREISRVQSFFANRSVLLFLELIGAVVAIAIMFCLDTGLGLFGLGGAAAVGGLGLLVHRVADPAARAGARALSDSAVELSSQLSHPDLVRGLGLVPATLARWQHRYGAALALDEAARDRAKAVQAIEHLLHDLIQMAVFVYVCLLLFEQAATAGMLVSVYFLSGNALQPFSHLTQSWENWSGGVAAWRRLRRVMRQEAAPEPLPRDPAAPAGLLLDGVAFHPPRREAPIVGGVALHLAPGAVCTVQGPNGVGKSTLMRLVLGLLPPTDGRVLLDGQDTLRCDRESLGARIGYLPQDVQLLDDDVFGNIGRGPGAAPEAVVAAARAAGAHEMIGRLPLGYQTPAGHTSGLSAGQRRLVGLARALYGDPALLVLDEPEVGLDGSARTEMRAAVERTRARGGVVLVVTHEPLTWSDVADIRLTLGPKGAWEAQSLRPGAAMQETGLAAH